MAERNRSHIFLDSPVNAERFTPTSSGRDGASPPTPANPEAHASHLQQSLSIAADAANQPPEARVRVEGAISGVYVEFESFPDVELALTSLEPQIGKTHPELRSVVERTIDDRRVQIATVFVPDGWIGRFIDRFEQYATERTVKGNRKHRKLVEPIAEIRRATLRALWTDPNDDFPDTIDPVWWELWLRRRDGVADRLESFAEQTRVQLGPRRLVLDDRLIVLVRATVDQLGAGLDVLDDMAELRQPAQAFHELADLDAADQTEFVADLAYRLIRPTDSTPRTCVLDTGVGSGHPLIAPALDPADTHTVDPAPPATPVNGTSDPTNESADHSPSTTGTAPQPTSPPEAPSPSTP